MPIQVKHDKKTIERVARMYHTVSDGARALGIAPGSFGPAMQAVRHRDAQRQTQEDSQAKRHEPWWRGKLTEKEDDCRGIREVTNDKAITRS